MHRGLYVRLIVIYKKAILIYQATHTELRLCMVTNHDYETKGGRQRITNFLKHADFTPLSNHEETALTNSERNQINQLLYEFAAEDWQELHRLLHHRFTDILEYVRLAIEQPWSPQQKDAAVFASFGGEDGLRDYIRNVLQRTAPRQ